MLVENQSEKNIKVLRTYVTNHQVISPYTPQHNGIYKRRNIRILDMTRCMLKKNVMPNSL